MYKKYYQSKEHIPIKKINEREVEELFIIVEEGDYNKIKNYISENNINYNVRNKDGENVLYTIIRNNVLDMTEKEKYEMIKFFIENGVSVNNFNKNNITPLHLASKYQLKSIVELLLKNGAEVNIYDSKKMLPIHYASQGKIKECKKKKIESLIPGKKKEKTEADTKEISNLTIEIINLLKEKEFKIYLKHVENSIKNIDKYTPIEDIKFRKNTMNKINEISMNININSEKKQKMINNEIKNLEEIIKQNTENKLSESLKELYIKKMKKGWSVIKEYNKLYPNDKVEDENNNESIIIKDIDIEYLENNIKKYDYDKTENALLLSNSSNDRNSSEMFKNMEEIYTNIHKILQFNYILKKLYLKSKKSIEYIDGVENKYILLGSEKNIKYEELNIDENVNIKDEGVFDIYNKNYEWIDKKKYNTDINGNLLIKYNHSLIQKYKIKSEGKDEYNYKLYNVSKISFAINQIKKHTEIIRLNNVTIINLLKINYYYEIYHRIITNNITSLLGMVNYIIQIDIQLTYLNENYKNMEKQYKLFASWLKNKSQRKAQDIITEIIRLINLIIKNLNELKKKIKEKYDIIYDYYFLLEKILNIIRKKSILNYTKSYYYETKFIDKEIEINNVYDRNILMIKKIPKNYEIYKSKYYSSEDYKSQIIRKFIPMINENNYQTYIFDHSNLNLNNRNLQIALSNQLKSKFENIKYNEPLIIPNEQIPKKGYLIENDVNNINNNKPLVTIPEIKNKEAIKDDNNIILKKPNDSGAKKNIGNIGFMNKKTIKKDEPALYSLGTYIDDHLKNMKIYIIKLLLLLYTKYENEDLLKKIKDNKILINDNDKTIYYITIAKIIDRLLIQYYKNIINKYVKKYISKLINKKNKKQINDEIILISKEKMNTDYEVKLNKLFKELINDYYENPENNEYERLEYAKKIMSDYIDDNKKQIEIYDYTKNDNLIRQCYINNDEIINILNKYGTNMNKQDIYGNTPLHYAFKILDKNIIEKLINNNAYLKSEKLKNNSNNDPLNEFIKQYERHLNVINNERGYFKNIYEAYVNKLKNKIYNNTEYKNNVIINFDILYPMLLTMYNNMFFFNMIKNINEWSENDNIKLIDLLEFFYKDQTDYNKTYILNNSYIKKNKYTTVLNEELKNINEKIKENKEVDANLNIQKLINNKIMEEKINMRETVDELSIIDINTDNVVIYYEKLLKNINYDYEMYANLWKNYINDEKNMKNITNIQIITNDLQKKMLHDLDNVKVITINLINNLHKKIYKYTIECQEYLSQKYLNENKKLNETINIMEHCLKNIIFTNLYYAINRIIMEYVKNIYNTEEKTVIDKIIDRIITNKELKSYIIDEMPMMIIKIQLDIYKDEEEEEILLIKTIDDIYEKITEIIDNENYIVGDNENKIINNIREYIIPYYKEITQEIIQDMKKIIESYNKYILNESKYIEILEIIKKKRN